MIPHADAKTAGEKLIRIFLADHRRGFGAVAKPFD